MYICVLKTTIMLRKALLLFISIFSFASAKAQSTPFYQEIGVMTGPVFFQGDFGEKGVVENTTQNVGVSGSFVYYISMNTNRRGWQEKFKLRLDATAMAVTLNHYGPSADSDTNFGEKLRAMQSNVKVGSVGAQVEFYPWKTDDYSNSAWTPYVALGTQMNMFSAKATSALGPIGNTNTMPTKYVDGFKNTSGSVMSVTVSLGVRYKLNRSGALILEGQIKQFFSDWIDGMNPDRRTYKENTTQDSSGTLNIGYIYYLD